MLEAEFLEEKELSGQVVVGKLVIGDSGLCMAFVRW
jgi:hypothetical protein